MNKIILIYEYKNVNKFELVDILSDWGKVSKSLEARLDRDPTKVFAVSTLSDSVDLTPYHDELYANLGR